MTRFLVAALCLVVSAVSAFSPPGSTFAVRKASSTSKLGESFGFVDLAEDTYENQPDFLKGEAEYKQWINKYKEDNLLNEKYNVLRRVRELDLLQQTVDQGVLSKLEDLGLDLETVEKLLPLVDDLELLKVAGSNQQLLVNLLAPLLVEGAPFILPVITPALQIGPSAFYLGAAVCAATEVTLIATHAELLNLPLGVVGGLLLVPLTVVLGGAGAAFSSLKKA